MSGMSTLSPLLPQHSVYIKLTTSLSEPLSPSDYNLYPVQPTSSLLLITKKMGTRTVNEVNFLRMIKKELFLKEQYSDMIISCRGLEFKVHRAIICPQSSFFEAAANGNFSVSILRSMVQIPDMSNCEADYGYAGSTVNEDHPA